MTRWQGNWVFLNEFGRVFFFVGGGKACIFG